MQEKDNTLNYDLKQEAGAGIEPEVEQSEANEGKAEVIPVTVISKDGTPIKIYTKDDQNAVSEVQIINDSPIARTEYYLKSGYEFRRNLVTGYVEYNIIGQTKFEQVTETVLNSIWRQALHANIQCTPGHLITLLNSDFSVSFDPIVDYVEGLPEWDNVTDHIGQLAESVETTNKEFFLKCLRKWLVAMVGCWMSPKVVNQTVLVFSGAQGIGKTTWVNKLVPPQLKEYYYSGTVNPNNKDTLIHLSECALINLDELENLNRTEIGTLKEIITKEQIRMRRPYGKSSELLHRRASFAGSVNQAQFLNDPTGSRRFLCFEALSFNPQHEVSIDLVYSQAFALFKSGFEFWFTQDEIRAVELNNEQYKSIPMEEELLLQLFEPCNNEEGVCEYLTATDIANAFSKVINVRVDLGLVNRIGKAASKHQFSKVKKQGLYKYALNRKQDMDRSISPDVQQEGEVTKD